MFIKITKLCKVYSVTALIYNFCRPMACESSHGHNFYTTIPAKIGIEVHGVYLKSDPPPEVIKQIIDDVHTHRIVIFRDQGVISGQRHIEISKWFGDLESTFYDHPKSPHRDVFRVSNDESEGCRNVGRTGWHIDGSFQPAPFAYSLYHMVEVPEKGDTVFAPLNELINGLPEEKLARWERLWMVSNMRVGRVHPMIYSHPVTGLKTLCFHLGMTEGFVWDYNLPQERVTNRHETKDILEEIHYEFVKDNGAIQYSHKWQPGDFIISDNLAVGHEATPETQYPRREVGLRVLHRTTIKGTVPPTKNYQPNLATTNHDEL